MRIITKIYQARVASKPTVVVNLLDFKQKPLVKEAKTTENNWKFTLGESFNIDNINKTVILPEGEKYPAIVVIETTKENQKELFKEIQLALKLAKKIK